MPLKIKMEKALLVFLGVTIALGALLCYNLYIWIGVSLLFDTLEESFTISNVETRVLTEGDSTSVIMTVTMTITNSFAGSPMNLYISVKTLYINNTPTASWNPVNAFTPWIVVPSLSSRSVNVSFTLSSDPLSWQNPTNEPLIFNVLVLAKTIVNEDPISIPFEKAYMKS
jgi:hypothetical protein